MLVDDKRVNIVVRNIKLLADHLGLRASLVSAVNVLVQAIKVVLRVEVD